MPAIDLRARTRNAKPRHDARIDFSHPPRSMKQSEASTSDSEEARRRRLLGEALLRLDARVFGAPWCERCRQQKELLAELIPKKWSRLYVDCGRASRCLACTNCKTTPTWRVNGRRYPGAFDVDTLTELVGLQAQGSRQEVTDRVIDAVDAGDPLGGLKLGDLPVGGRDRRHARRSGWAKRAAVRLASLGRGKFWCEFGELITESVADVARRAAKEGRALAPM